MDSAGREGHPFRGASTCGLGRTVSSATLPTSFVGHRASRISIAVQLAEQVLTALRSVSITASIGVVDWDGRSIQTCEQIELAAEQQLQRAKHDGRNCVRWSPNVIEHRVPAALLRGQTLDAIPVEVETERTQRHAA